MSRLTLGTLSSINMASLPTRKPKDSAERDYSSLGIVIGFIMRWFVNSCAAW